MTPWIDASVVNVEQAPKTPVAEADPPPERGRPPSRALRTILDSGFRRGKGDGTPQGERQGNTGDPPRWSQGQPATREGQAGPGRESERPIVPRKPGNAGGGKGPHFGSVLDVDKSRESGHVAYNLQKRLGDRQRN